MKKIIIIIASVVVLISILIFVAWFFFFKSPSIEELKKSVVMLNVYNSKDELISTASGLIMFNKNILITNAHVIENGTRVEAVSEDDEKIFVDGAIAYSQDLDILILKLNSQNNIKPLEYTYSYAVGDRILAIGSPLGLKNSVSDGMLSNINEVQRYDIQHTAPISPGSSGGGLFTTSGKVIGINSATDVDGQNINLAVSIQKVKKLYDANKKNKSSSIKNIQLNKGAMIESTIFNNKIGQELIKYMQGIDGNNFIEFRTLSRIDNLPGFSGSGYYVSINDISSYIDQMLVIMGVGETNYDTDELVKEAEIMDIVIVKLNEFTNDVYSTFSFLSRVRTDGLYDCSINCMGVTPTTYSTKYKNGLKNATIGHVNNYLYSVATKEDSVKKKIIDYIAELSNY